MFVRQSVQNAMGKMLLSLLLFKVDGLIIYLWRFLILMSIQYVIIFVRRFVSHAKKYKYKGKKYLRKVSWYISQISHLWFFMLLYSWMLSSVHLFLLLRYFSCFVYVKYRSEPYSYCYLDFPLWNLLLNAYFSIPYLVAQNYME